MLVLCYLNPQDFKTESGDSRSRMYSYPSYISIGTNNLDDIDPTWSHGNSFQNVHESEAKSDERPGKATKGGAKSKQMPIKPVNSKQHNKKLQSKQFSSKTQNNKQSSNKQQTIKQVTGKQGTTKKTQAQRIQAALSSQSQKNKAVVNSNKQVAVNVSNKRKATTEPGNSGKNAKIKKKESKKQMTEKEAQDFRRRSTNSMRLRKLTSAGEICHDDSSESMSESERLAEAIRRSKIETSMSNVGDRNKNDRTLTELARTRSKLQVIDKLKGKKNAPNIVGKSERLMLAKSKQIGNVSLKKAEFSSKKDHSIGSDKEHFVGHFKATQKKLKKSLRSKKTLPSMAFDKKTSFTNRDCKSQTPVKRPVTTTSKVATTLIGKIIPIQAPMIWKLVNSAQQQKSETIDLKKIQNMKNNATLKFTGEQKVLITFNPNSEGQNSTAVKTIIANVTSPSKNSAKSSTGVKTRQAVLLPLSAAGDSPASIGSGNSPSDNTANQPVRILRSSNKSVPNLSNYSIIPLSSLVTSSAIVSAIPHLLSAVQNNVKNSPEMRLTTTSQKPITYPPPAKTVVRNSPKENASTLAPVSTPVKLIVVSSVTPTTATSNVSTGGACVIASIHKVSASATVTTTSSAPTSLSTSSSSATSQQAFLPQSSKTLIIKHSSNSSQVFTLIPTMGKHLLPCSGTPIAPKTTVSGTTSNAATQSQLIRPIFITAQPNPISQKPSTAANSSPQAVFIATAPINPSGNQSVSGIQLTLSPSKSLLAGAIPIIVGPQVSRSSTANLSSQIQLALSSLQSQNLVMTSSIKNQQSTASSLAASTVQNISVTTVVQQTTHSATLQPVTSAQNMTSPRPKPAILRRSLASGKVEIPTTGSTVARKISFSETSATTKGLIIREPPVIMSTSVVMSTMEIMSSTAIDPIFVTRVNASDKDSGIDVEPKSSSSPKEQVISQDLMYATDVEDQPPQVRQNNVKGSAGAIETVPGAEILQYLPTLPGACITSLTSPKKSPVKEKLIVQILLSKLKRRPAAVVTESTASFTLKDSVVRAEVSPEKDLADIKQIIKQTAILDIPVTVNQKVSTENKVNELGINSVLPLTAVLPQPVLQVPQPISQARTLAPTQKFVEIRPAISQPYLIANKAVTRAPSMSVSRSLVPALSVIHTPALTTPIVTPVVTNTSLHQVYRPITAAVTSSGTHGKSPERLPVSIKLASIASGSRLKMARPVNTVPNVVPIPLSIKPASVQPLQAPLLPRPTQGYLTVLAPKPTTTMANQQQSPVNTPGTVQRFPVTYLTTLPLQIGNRPRTQVMIQPAPRAILNASISSTSQTGTTTNTVRFGTQTMVIPVSLSFPGMNIQQMPVSSNVLLSSLYSVVSTSSLNQTKTGVHAVQSQTLLPSTTTSITRLQKIAPYPSTSVSKLVIGKPITSFPKPASVKGQKLTTVGRDDSSEASLVNANTSSKQEPVSSVGSNSSAPVNVIQTPSGGGFSVQESSITVLPETSRPSVIAAISQSKSVKLSETSATSERVEATTNPSVAVSCAVASVDTSQGSEGVSKESEGSMPRDCITDLTNSLRSLLKADIKEGSTVTINIQGSPVTYALKDGRLFSMPHNLPTKKESKDSKANTDGTDKSIPISSPSVTSLSASQTLSKPTVVTSSVSMATSTSPSFSNTTPVTSSVIKPNIVARRKSDLPAPCSQLRISVPKSLLFRKVGATRSVSTGSANFCELNCNGDVRPLNSNAKAPSAEVTGTNVSMATRPISNIINNLPQKFSKSDETGNHNAYEGESKVVRSETNNENSSQANRKRTVPDDVDLKFGFECDFCSEKFVSYNLMWRHRKLHLNDSVNFTNARRASLPPALCPKIAFCERCNKFFEGASNLELHKQLNNCLAPEHLADVPYTNGSSNAVDVSEVLTGIHQSYSAPSHNSPSIPLYSQESAKSDVQNSNVFNNARSPEFDICRNEAHSRNEVICENKDAARNEAGHNKEHDCTEEIIDREENDSPLTLETLDEITSLNSLVQYEGSKSSEQNVSDMLSELTNNLIGPTTPSNVNDMMDDVMDGFDLNANFDDQVFEDSIDVKPDLKPAKRLRRMSGKSLTPRKKIIARKYSNIGKNLNSQKRNKRRSKVTISDDEEAFDDAGVDLDGEFITVGKLNGEFTCSRCDLGFQNEKELDDHNETFHDSLRYNFRERRSVSNLGYLDDFEFDLD